MKKKYHYLFHGWGYLIVVAFICGLFIFEEVPDTFGLIAGIGFLCLFGFLSYINFKKAKASGEDEFEPPPDASTPEGMKYFKRLILLLIVSSSLIALITVVDLNSLESGEANSVRLWAPIAYVYGEFGYWAAVLTAPAGALGLSLLLALKMKKQGAL